MKRKSMLLRWLAAAFALVPVASFAELSPPCPLPEASYNSGVYRNIFTTIGVGTQTETDTKINTLWNTYFSTTDANRLLNAADSSKSYILNTQSPQDIRSEGMSYGMMIAVQMDNQAVFDKLWNFAVTYSLQKTNSVPHHFAWQLNPTSPYAPKSNGGDGPAADGEIYFAAALIFADSRWGSGGLASTDSNYKNYRYWAKEVLRILENNLFDKSVNLVKFSPNLAYTDPSYQLPVFYEMFAIFLGKTGSNDFWRVAANAARVHLVNATAKPSGLTSDYAHWDGSAVTKEESTVGNDNAPKFAYDSWRVINNIGMDTAWCTHDSYGASLIWQQLLFFKATGGTWNSSTKKWSTPYGNIYNFTTGKWDGSEHSAGLVAMNAVGASYFTDNNNPTQDALSRPFIEDLWNQAPPAGDGRYYGALLHTFGMLHLAGRYKLYHPVVSQPFKSSAQSADGDPANLKLVQPRIAVKNSTAQTLTNFKAKYFFTTVEGKTPVLTDVLTPNSNVTLEQLDTRSWQVVLDYSGKSLAPGASLPATGQGETFSLRYSDNSDFDKADDYSQPYNGASYSDTTRIPVYDGAGNLAMGAPPRGKLPSSTGTVRSQWSNMSLTLTSPQNDAETRAQPLTPGWNTQTWVTEPVQDTAYVRLKNTSNGRYLNVQNDGENAKVVAYDFNVGWGSELWLVEPAGFGSGVRLKNVWSGKYLTVVDAGTYSQVLSKALVTGWPSQIWTIQ